MKIALLLGGWLLAMLPALAASPVQSFEAHYTVYAKGIKGGEGLIRLELPGDDRYRMQSRVRATGLVGLIFRDTIEERVEGRLNGISVLPSDYRFERTGGSREELTEYRFDWNAGTVQARHNDRQAVLELNARTLDPLSTYLQVMYDLIHGETADRYRLLDETEVRSYGVAYHGRETLDTPLGVLDVLRVSRQRPGSSRRIEFWFAPAYDYLPVQIIQYKDGSENLRMMIRELRRG